MATDKNRDSSLLEQLEIIIAEETHITLIINYDIKFPCLKGHIYKANSRIEDPYTREEIEEIGKRIRLFFYDMVKNRGNRTCCEELVTLIHTLPEATFITRYERNH